MIGPLIDERQSWRAVIGPMTDKRHSWMALIGPLIDERQSWRTVIGPLTDQSQSWIALIEPLIDEKQPTDPDSYCRTVSSTMHSPNLPYAEGIGSPEAAIPLLKVR